MCWIRLWARSNACASGLLDWTFASVTSLVSASRLICQSATQKKKAVSLYKRSIILIDFSIEKDGESSYLFRGLDGHKVIVNSLGFSCHFLRFQMFVVFHGQPKFQILITEFANEKGSVKRRSIWKDTAQKKHVCLINQISITIKYIELYTTIGKQLTFRCHESVERFRPFLRLFRFGSSR